MLSYSTLSRAQDILERISNKQQISLEERIFVQNLANKDQKINARLKRARRMNIQKKESDGIDNLLNDLDIGEVEANNVFKPDQDDLGDWFSGAPSWLIRS